LPTKKNKHNLLTARGEIGNAKYDARVWVDKATMVLNALAKQPSGILSGGNKEVILVCRACYIYFPESAKALHTQDCAIKQLLDTRSKFLPMREYGSSVNNEICQPVVKTEGETDPHFAGRLPFNIPMVSCGDMYQSAPTAPLPLAVLNSQNSGAGDMMEYNNLHQLDNLALSASEYKNPPSITEAELPNTNENSSDWGTLCR